MTRPTIRPMTAAEQQAYAATVADGYFRQRFEFGNEPEHVARAHTAEAMDRLWPGGRPAPGNYVFAAEVDGVVVGSLWLAEQSPGGPEDQGWIYDVQVVPDQRGKGLRPCPGPGRGGQGGRVRLHCAGAERLRR